MRIACIGSRETPSLELRWMERWGEELVLAGHTLASGGAQGADQAWVRLAGRKRPGKVEVFLPWASYEREHVPFGVHATVCPEERDDPELYEEAARHHPSWRFLKPAVRKLMARNVLIVRGSDLCLAYLNHQAPGGGGTGHGVRWCQANGVRVVDLAGPGGMEEMAGVVASLTFP